MTASLTLTHFRSATGHPTFVIARRNDAAIFRFIFLSAWEMVVLIMAESLPDYPAAVSLWRASERFLVASCPSL